MDYIYIPIGMFVSILVLWKRELLVERTSFRLILGVSMILFITGVVLHWTDADRESSSGALLTPLVSLGLYRLLHRVFLHRFRRDPRDTYLDWTSGMAVDRLFNIAYFSLSFLICMMLTIGSIKLARAGF